MTKMTYEDTLVYMYQQLPMYQRQGAPAFKKTLDNIIELCNHLDNPHQKIKTIHVGGTNGKGTTAHILAAILQAQGLKVGLYTSPHYKDFRERIKVDGQLMDQQSVIDFIHDHQAIMADIQPSFFEITVAMAFDYFYKAKVDVAIIEVGLGGRLDSTNIIKPLMSIITNISLDHQSMLGDTLELIAKEKAGIIKPHIPILIGERQASVSAVFDQVSQVIGAPITYATDRIKLGERKDRYDVWIDEKSFLKGVSIEQDGPFYLHNLKTALVAAHDLAKKLKINKNKLKYALAHVSELTYYIGRWQVLGKQPLVIADSAHNEGGLNLVLNRLSLLDVKKQHIVLGFVNDKDVGDILSMFPKEAEYYFAKADIPRGLDAGRLQLIAKEHNLEGTVFESVWEAYQAALSQANEDDLVYVGGSIFVVAEVI